ncbi:hypothetical protein OHA37_17705 [Streptomyces sp. NBC_00335]|uniref:hypothetical protein n=1 Tax=unclassified Streptomyces TaxID=2593676 RepID=UPI00224E86D3|nr:MULTISPECIES: hypothetical protein [unclassified Streptomyces]MCX5405716.1 hypothetical protein [Streptomyces sp. NBC_00086]
MNRTMRHHLSAVAATAALTVGVLATAPIAQASEGPDLSNPATVLVAEKYSCGPETASDQAVASQLSGQLTGTLRGALDSYRVSCARAIVKAVEARGLPHRAAVLAVTTSIVETTLVNYPSGDRDSVGLFQQRDPWGSFEQRMNPTWSTNAFLNALLKVNNWQTRPIGEVCQAVQISAFPDRYQVQASDGQRIVDALFGKANAGPDNVGIFRPSTGEFHLRYDNGSLAKVAWGQSGDLPVSANWDGAGPDNVGIFRPSTGEFHLRYDNGSLAKVAWGQSGDLPVSANWDGAGPDNVGIFRPSTGEFHLRYDNGSLTKIAWGQAGDQPIAGNWDGGAAANVGIFRPSTGEFHLRMDNGSLTKIAWGQSGDVPVTANWDGAGPDNVGIFRPSTGEFHLRMDNGSLTKVAWGAQGDLPVSANWDAGS